MTEGTPLFAMMLADSMFLGSSEEMEQTIKPLPAQFNLGPGDKCLAAAASTVLEDDFTVLEIVDPEEYAAEFPDWIIQSGWGSHVLAQWFSHDYPAGDLGWFARVKLIKITDEQYAEVNHWRTEGFPSDPPDWVVEALTNYTDTMAQFAPAMIPVLVACPKCGQREVYLHASGRKLLGARCGQVERDGKTVYVPIADPVEETTWTATLVCQNPDCGAFTNPLDNEEWDLSQSS